MQGCREIDFVKETVRTLAGNGTKGADYRGGKKGAAQVPSAYSNGSAEIIGICWHSFKVGKLGRLQVLRYTSDWNFLCRYSTRPGMFPTMLRMDMSTLQWLANIRYGDIGYQIVLLRCSVGTVMNAT